MTISLRAGALSPMIAPGRECLALEPSSVSSTDGMAGAVARGEAIFLPPGGAHTGWIELTPLQVLA